MKKCGTMTMDRKRTVCALRGAVVRREQKDGCGAHIHKGHYPHRKQSHLPDLLGDAAASREKQFSSRKRLKATVIMLI